ncbi:type I 3-dehydroquinate dehydratase, partial [Mesorhizobium sp. M8A.F.Ca.ET.207.01.1.1]
MSGIAAAAGQVEVDRLHDVLQVIHASSQAGH